MAIDHQPRAATADDVSPVDDSEKQTRHKIEPPNMEDSGHESDSDKGSTRKQEGVKKVEAITTVWSPAMLWVTFAILYMVTFVDGLLGTVNSAMTPYVTSDFAQHSLLSTIGVVATIAGGVVKLPLAKVLDIWGRVQGFSIMLVLMVVGGIMKATCTGVSMYAAAHTFYWVGHLGYLYVITIVLADMTSLKNRSIMIGINGTSTIITTFAGPRIAQLFLTQVKGTWHWAYGAFLILLVAFSIPVIVNFVVAERKAEKLGISPKREASRRSLLRSVQFYVIQFDVPGMILTTAGFALILLPFSIASTAPQGWKTPYIIAMVVVGVVCLGLFALWERYVAPVSYVPFKYLKDRTILGASMTYGFMFLSIYCWDGYYSSFLQVVNGLNINDAQYINSAMSLVSAFLYPFVGYAYRYFGTFKWLTIGFGVPFTALGTGLIIYFRHDGVGSNWLAMCQVFMGIGTCFLSSGAYIAAMAAVPHNEIAVVVAVVDLFGSVGAAVGEAVGGALWTSLLPVELAKLLPKKSRDDLAEIVGSFEVAMSYAPGSATRNAINEAYGAVMRKMVIAGACFVIPVFLSMAIWRNIHLVKVEDESEGGKKQTKGTVF